MAINLNHSDNSIESEVLFNYSVANKIVNLAGGENFDCSAANVFSEANINGNKTYTVSNVPTEAYSFVFVVNLYTSGTITWPAGTGWIGGEPTYNATEKHVVMFLTVDGGTSWIAKDNLVS